MLRHDKLSHVTHIYQAFVVVHNKYNSSVPYGPHERTVNHMQYDLYNSHNRSVWLWEGYNNVFKGAQGLGMWVFQEVGDKLN